MLTKISDLYGVPRTTFDIDILVPPDKNEIKKILLVLEKIGFKELYNIENPKEMSFISVIKEAIPEVILKLRTVRIKNKIEVDMLVAPSLEFFDFIWKYKIEARVGKIKKRLTY